MRASINIPVACALGVLVSACGGGSTAAGSGVASSASSSATATSASSVFVPDEGRLLAAQCAQCHGTDGRSVSGIEGLAGEAGEIASEMLEMQSSTDVSLMHKQAKGYTPLQIQAIEAYFASLYGNNGGGSDD